MYSVVLVLAATANMESTSCHRFRCCAPVATCCAPVPVTCCGTTAAAAPGGTTAPAVSGKLSGAEEKMLAELLKMFKSTLTPTEYKQYDDWFHGITPAERLKEFNDVTKKRTAPLPMGPAPLTKEEEKMLSDLMGQYSKEKDKDGKDAKDAKWLKQYEQWFREQSPDVRAKEYKSEFKGAAPMDKGGDKGGGKSARIDAPARILVHLPADAILTIDGNATRSTSASRAFVSPALSARNAHFYEMQATVERSGMQIQVSRLIRVQAGVTTEVNIDIPSVQHVVFSQR